MTALLASLALAAPISDEFSGGFIRLTKSIANDPSSRLDQ
jgi:hypothetical protein